MSRRPLAVLLLVVLAGTSSFGQPAPAPTLVDADAAWAAGDYPTALRAYLTLLKSSDGDRHLEAIALQTGELYQSAELTPDGRAPRFSGNGQLIAYETGLEVSRRTRVVSNDASFTAVADLAGVSATFSPDGTTVAYLKIAENADLAAATRALDTAPLAAQNRNALIQAVQWEIYRSATVTVRDLASGRERELAAPGLVKTGLTYGGDGRTLYFLGASEADLTRNDIYGIAEGREAARVGDADGFKGVPIAEPSGRALLYVPTPLSPFRRPQAPGAAPAPAGGRAGGPATPSFGIIDLASSRTRTIEGSSPSFSADGRSLTYVVRAGAESQLLVGDPLGQAAVVKRTTARLEAPALSPDGQRLAYQMMTRDDWEIYLSARDGSGEQRLTRDVQHDVLPRFLTADRLVAAVGEARHRRSFLYDLTTGRSQRLFHNNTVRTIAPEYQWVPSPDGQTLIVGAERDGDTVSPERGVYRVDLRTRVAKADLLTRLEANLAAETSLRERTAAMFAPISDAVRRVVDAVSIERIFQYQDALFDFDSKHITQPGNKLAAEYLFATYKSFGYEPEMQSFEQRTALGGRTANVLATLKGTVNPELVYVVSSHFDSVAGGPGADDNTSGTAALLEAARVLARHPQPATIVFASFTGEEAGLLGSREFVRQAVANKMQLVGALNNDMIGWSNDQRLDNTIRYSNPGIRDIQHGAAIHFTRLITYDALYFKSTDAAAYYDAYGDIVGGIGSYPVLSNPHYHQAHDLLEFENHELITETSKTTAATLMLLASSPSRIKGLTVETQSASGTTVSWTASPEKGISAYIVSYTSPGGVPARQVKVATPRATLPALAPGAVVAVKAVNDKGLEGWDWARVTVAASSTR